jgi:hypothetical protein
MPSPLPTLLFCTSFVDSQESWDARYRPWVDFQQSMPLCRDATFMFDDASPYRPDDPRIVVGETLPDSPDHERIHFHRFGSHLGRRGLTGHLGWWRSFTFALDVAERYGFRKLIHVESDAYVLSRRGADYIEGLASGWTALWCPRYNMPETGIQVIVEDQFAAMRRIADLGVETLARSLAETSLPFTHVEKGLAGSRYGEYRKRVPSYADYACQVLPGMVPARFGAPLQ